MRKESLFPWQHALIELNGISMCLFNIRLWNGNLEHFLCDKIYSSYSCLFCFTETNISDSLSKQIDEILDDWKDIHKNTRHGLALCYNVAKVNKWSCGVTWHIKYLISSLAEDIWALN